MSELRKSYTTLTNPITTKESFEEKITGLGFKYVGESTKLAVAPTTNHSVLIGVKDKPVLVFGFDIEFNQERVEFSLHEDVTSVTGSTPMLPPPYNVNRPISDSVLLESEIEVGNMTITGGTVIYGPSSGLGTAGSGNKGGAGSLTGSEDFIWLKPNTNYVFQVTNSSVANVDIVLTVKMAESEDFSV